MFLSAGHTKCEYKDINVPVSPNDTKTRPVRLETLNLDGIRNPNLELVKSIMKQKENSFTEGTIIIFPHSIHPDTTGYTAVNFEIETYAVVDEYVDILYSILHTHCFWSS